MTEETDVKLCCGVERLLRQEIKRNADVEALQETIAGILSTEQLTVPPRLLTLYLARKKGETMWLKHDRTVKDFLRGSISTEYEEMLSSSRINKKELFGPSFTPGDEEIHVLVELPPDQAAVTMVDRGWTAKWVNEFHKNQLAPHQLPRLGELADFIENELPEKITLHQEIYDTWTTKMTFESPELMAKLFKIDNLKQCVNFLFRIGSRIVYATDPGDTETSFISFWDDLIRNVLNFVLHDIGKSDRNLSRSASTGSNRPDYLFIVDSVCVFRGEEKAPGEQMETPRRELFKKLVWSYGDAPYLFGYAAVGYEARLYAIARVHDDVDAIELGVYDLKHLEGRFRLLLAILNVARLLRSLAKSARDEYKKLSRDRGVRVLLEPSCVVKCFPEALFQRAKDHVEAVYKVLEEHAIPNVDRLDHADQNAMRLIFKPRGQEKRPANLVELFHALANVLQALVKLHAASWMHRDIRWPNVIKSRDSDNSWFLIDFMDAAQSPQVSPSGNHLSQAEHAPEIFSDGNHTTAVDVWSVGRLIQTCGDVVYGSWYDTGRERTQFLELLMHDDPSRRPTAVAALDRLRQLEQEYLERQKRNERKKKQRRN
ncbi:Crinkler (CRN) family protein [Phytophthora palmivora]|uniref:Crinkler (CRN) family protein n=1 Tax=Phytophthora palmivora TaxID=4796 RepID=A0A2P4YI59_9STRA|nr:Crinkler (CRN) family protein [Phytophthora palmivora]